MIREKQQEALIKVRNFIAGQDLNDPNLTGAVWDIINDSNLQKQINKKNSLNFKENWSGDLIGELQRELVNYQLHQLKRGNPPRLFAEVNNVFDKIPVKNSVLDIGCTSGYYYEIINYYFPNKFNYSGCDYNEQSIKLAKYYYPEVNFFVDDITNLALEDLSYDVTFLSGVIEHIPEYERGINELCRITKKYIILHRVWLSEDHTTCSIGTQYFVPIIRYQYNKVGFIEIFNKNDFKIKWESAVYDGNCRTYLLEKS